MVNRDRIIMKNVIGLFICLLISCFVMAQSNPSGLPSQNIAGWITNDYTVPRLGNIIPRNTPSFTPRFAGTSILYQQAGVDSSIYYWNGSRWQKLITTISVDTIYRTQGVDSIYYTINSIQRAIKDSVGGTDTSLAVYTSQEGLLYNKSSWANTSDFTVRGATGNVVGSSIQFSGGANTFTQTFDLDTTMRERWVMHIEQVVGTVSGTSDGLGIGIRSVNPNFAPGVAGILITNNTGNAGKLLLLDITSGASVLETSDNAIAISAGDTIVFELERDVFTFRMRGYNRTTKSTTITLEYTYTVAPSPPAVLPNTGTFSIFSVGGTQTMTALSVLSKETKRAPLMCVGDSKTTGYFSSNAGRYGTLLYPYFTPTIVHAGSADRLNELLETTDEVLSINPINLTISIGSNDIGYGASVAQVFQNYKTYVSILEGAGINVYHLLPFYQTTIVAELDSLADSIRLNYNNIIDCRTPIRLCTPCFLASDSVHLNPAGDSLVFQTILNSGVLKKYYKSPVLSNSITGTSGSVLFFGSNGSVTEDNANLFWDNTNNRLGIATNSPQAPLHVNGNLRLESMEFRKRTVAGFDITGYHGLTDAAFLNEFFPGGVARDVYLGVWTNAIASGGNGEAFYINKTVNSNILLTNHKEGTGSLRDIVFSSNGFAGETMRLQATTQYVGVNNNNPLFPLDINGKVAIRTMTAPPSTYNVVVHGLTDSVLYQVPSSAFGSTTIYNGDGSISSNRTVTLGSSNLTFNASSTGDLEFTLGSDATGDVYYRNAGGAFTRLPIGSSGDVLTVASGIPSWATPSASGISTLNTLTASTQSFATGTSGTDFNISSSTSTHTFNIPSASTSNRGLVTISSQTFGGLKTFNDGVYITNSSATGRLRLYGNISSSTGPGTSGTGLQLEGFTYTDNAAAGTQSGLQAIHLIGQPTITSGNAITYSGDAVTLRVNGAPVASGSMTLSHPWAIYANNVSQFGAIACQLNEQAGDATIGDVSNNIYTGAGGSTWTLASLAIHPGKFIYIKNAGGGNLTVQRGGSDNIYNTSSVTSITVAAGADVVLVAGSSFWYVLGM